MATRKKVNEQVAEVVERQPISITQKIHDACALASKMEAGFGIERMAAELFNQLGLVLVPKNLICTKEGGVNRAEMTFTLINVDNPEELIDLPSAGEAFGAPGKCMNTAILNAYKNLLCLLLMVTPQSRRGANEKIVLEYYKDMKTILDYWKVTDISQATDEQVQAAADQIRERTNKDE